MISIIIPFYKAELTLQRSIDSALNQTYPHIEIILVDNNSTDQGHNIVNQYLLEHPRKIQLFQESRQGANFARNTGLKNAQGDWLQFLDADDEIAPEKISHQMELLQMYPETDVICAPYTELIPKPYRSHIKIYTKRGVNSDPIMGLIKSTLGCTTSNLWRKSALLSVGGWDENRTSSQEYFLMLKLWKADKKLTPDIVNLTMLYRERDSVSRPESTSALVQSMHTRLDYFSSLLTALKEKNKDSPEISTQINAQMIQNLHVHFFHAYSHRQEIKSIANGFGLSIDLRNKLKFYPHFIYSKYAFNKSHKYLRFAYNFFTHLNKLL